MSMIGRLHDEIMTDLKSKGFGGYVESLNNYKTSPTMSETRIVKTPNPNRKNEMPATGPGGHSLLKNPFSIVCNSDDINFTIG
jgi:hypothetical protein